MQNRALVLLSGGIDSTTCFYLARKEFGANNVGAILVDYGQRHKRELGYAKRTCSKFAVGYNTLDLSSIIPRTMLTDPEQIIPSKSYSDLDPGISPTYVPFRNGLMLSAVTSSFFGEMKNLDLLSEGVSHYVYFGAHAEDAQNWAYADCTPEFIGAMANLMHVGTYGAIRLCTPFQWSKKSDIIKVGDLLDVDWNDTWSCYKGGDKHCGQCPTCIARRESFKEAGVADPTEYEV